MKPVSGISLRDVFKGYSYDQDKVVAPEETVHRVTERFRNSGKKILLKTIRIDSGRLNIPVFISLCGPEATRLTGTKKQMGKGATPEQSRASALMELAERFSFFAFFKDRQHPIYKWKEIEADAIEPAQLLLAIHDGTTDLGRVSLFLKDLPMRWVAAASLSDDKDVWVPIDWFYLINEYNGAAAGNTIEEAIVQSMCEVIERHVGTVISYNHLVTPIVDFGTVKTEAARELIRKFVDKGIKLYLRDFSLDTGIPSVGALAYDPSTFPEKSEIVFTVGTTTDPEKSLCRVLTEVAQLAGDFENRTSYKPTYPKYGSLEEAKYLMADGPVVSLDDLPSVASYNLKVEIESLVNRVRSRMGWKAFVVNTTHPDLNIPAVYTIMPGAYFLDRTTGTDFPQHMARTLLSYMNPKNAAFYIERLIKFFGQRYDLRFFMAHAMEESGDVVGALDLYKSVLSEAMGKDERASVLVNIASCYARLENFQSALKYLEKAEELQPDLKELHHLKGVCLFKLKRHEESIEAFERVIELDPSSAIDYANIASNLRDMGYTKEAIILYEMALDMDPSLEFAHHNLCSLKAKEKQA